MFGSHLPIDTLSHGFDRLYDAYERTVAAFSEDERDAMFNHDGYELVSGADVTDLKPKSAYCVDHQRSVVGRIADLRARLPVSDGIGCSAARTSATRNRA